MIEEILQELASLLGPDLGGFLMSLDPETQQVLVELASDPNGGGVEELAGILQEMMDSIQGSGQLPGQMGVEQVGPAMDPSQMPPGGGMPPGMGMDPMQLANEAMMAGQPMPEMLQGEMPGAMMPPDAPAPPTPPEMEIQAAPSKPKPKKWKAPKMKPSRYAKSNPTLERVLEDARIGKQEWSARDARITEDVEMAHLTYDLEEDDPALINGEWIHRRADPVTLLHKVAGLTAATGDRYKIHVAPRHDSDEYVEAAQTVEDYMRSCRTNDEERYFEMGSTEGDPRMPLPRHEAMLMALEGGMGWSWYVDPDAEEHNFQAELIPVSQLYPLGHAVTRQVIMPLHKARSKYEEIEKQFPLDAKDAKYYETWEIGLTEWADTAGYKYAIAWSLEGKSGGVRTFRGPKSNKEDSGWIQKPTKLGYGIPYFNYVIWGGTAALPNSYNSASHTRFIGYGVLTMLRRTFRLMDIMVSAIATGTIKFANPPLFRTIAENRDMSKVPELDLGPGKENFGRPTEDVKPLYFDIAQTQAGVAFVNSLAQELNSAIPPVLMGGGANSGFEYMQKQEDASASMITPIVDALQNMYQMMNRQRAILAYRFAKRDADGEEYADREYFDKYEFTSMDKKGYSYYGTLKPKHLELAGIANLVRYDERNLSERMQLASLATQLVGAHLMSQEQALILLGNDDPRAELMKIIQDAAFLDPDVLKAITEASIKAGGNQLLMDAWERVYYLAPQKGSQPAPAGMPTPANVPGAMAGGIPSEVGNPAQNMMGNMGY